MRTALITVIPVTGTPVEELRARTGDDAARGIPAHITVLMPFRDREDLSTDDLRRVERICAGARPIRTRLTHVDRFGADTLWLGPEDPTPFTELTDLIVSAFPDRLPYGGAHDEVIPHLTIGQSTDDAVLAELEARAITALPIDVSVDTLTLLVERAPDRWMIEREFALGAARPVSR